MGVEDQAAASPDAAADETLDDVSSTVTDGADASADSSPASTDDKASLLSIVRDARQPKPDAAPSAADESDGHDKDKASAPKEPDDENFSDVPFNKHPRFRELIEQRNAFKPDAERYRNLQTFLDQNAMSGEEAAQALNLAALRKRDPEAAWAELKPYVQQLLVDIGEVLPPDLKAQVAAGQLAPDVAKQLAKERAKATTMQGKMSFDQQVEARKQERAQQQAAEEARGAILKAIRDWDAAARVKDPEFAKKYEDVQEKFLFIQHRDGRATTPEMVRKQLNAALKAVNDRITAARPRRPALTPVTGGSTAGNVRAEPQSMIDIVRMHRTA